MIRFILCIIILIIFAIYSIVDILISFVIDKINKKTLIRYYNAVVYIVFKAFCIVSGADVKVLGLENLIDIENESVFIIANHRGFFDIIIGYVVLHRVCSFVGKTEFKKVPLLSTWMKKIRCYFLDRKDLRSGAMMVIDSVKNISEGISVYLFPEGTRNKNDNPLDLLEFKSGAFKIPEKANCKILPMSFIGTEEIYEKHKPFIKSAKVYVNIGKAYKIEDLTEEERLNIGEYNQKLVRELLQKSIEASNGTI